MNLTFANIVYNIIGFLQLLVIPIIGLAVVVFLYGLLIYIFNSSDESKRVESIKYITYGLLGLFIMISMWSLVYIISEFFGFSIGITQIAI